MEKDEIKQVEMTEDKKRAANNTNLLDLIIMETFTRHAKLDENEFLEKIGFKDTNKNEDEAVRIAKFNVIMELTKELIHAKGVFNMANGLLKTYLIDESIEEKIIDEKKGE